MSEISKMSKKFTLSEVEALEETAVEAYKKNLIEQLEAERRQCEQAALWANGPELREQLQTLWIGIETVLPLIKGETK